MVALARRALPYTPVGRPLKELAVALVSSAGVHPKSDEPFNLEGEERYYVFPGDIPARELMLLHGHYDRSNADRHIKWAFPIDRLREFAAEGYIKGVSNKRVVFMGYTKKVGEMFERVAPALAEEIECSQADAAVMTAG